MTADITGPPETMDKKTGIKRIWQERFNDSGQWMDMVFSRIYRPDDAFALESDGETVSSLLLRPLDYIHFSHPLQCSYIYGAATLKRRQGQGHMTRLLDLTLRAAMERGDAVMFLRPSRKWLYGFYARFGFTPVVLADRQRFTSAHRFISRPDNYSVETTVYDIDRLADDYTRLSACRQSTLIHSAADFKTILIDNSIDNGVKAIVNDHDGNTSAIAFATLSQAGHVHVSDLTASSEEAAEEALAAIKAQIPDRMMIVDAYPERKGIDLTPKGMARIIDARRMLSVIAEANTSLRYVIRLSDPIIKENNAIFAISSGKVTRISADGKDARHDLQPRIDLDVSIDTLTSILFSSAATGSIFNLPTARPYLSLLLD